MLTRWLRGALGLLIGAVLGLSGCGGSGSSALFDQLTMNRASMGPVQGITSNTWTRPIELSDGFDPTKDITWPPGSGNVNVAPAVYSPSASGFVRDYSVRAPGPGGRGTCEITVVVPTNQAGDVSGKQAKANLNCSE